MATKKSELMKNIPANAKARIVKDKTQLSEFNYKGNDKPYYTRLQFSRVYIGYDLMENLSFVRSSIQKKYNVTFRMLEQILFLTPKNFFTLKDFKHIAAVNFTYKRIDIILKEGYVAVAAKGKNKEEHIYTPTAKARNLCQEFHEMLSREIPIQEEALEKSEYKTDNVKAEIIKVLNKKQKPKTTSVLWARKV